MRLYLVISTLKQIEQPFIWKDFVRGENFARARVKKY